MVLTRCTRVKSCAARVPTCSRYRCSSVTKGDPSRLFVNLVIITRVGRGFTVEPQNKQPRKHSRAPLSLSLSLFARRHHPLPSVNVTHQSHSELYTRRRFPVPSAWTNFPSVGNQEHELNASIDESEFRCSSRENIRQFRIFNSSFAKS